MTTESTETQITTEAPSPPKRRVFVLDLETLGTTPGSVILTIGAVEIDRAAGAVTTNRFYSRVDTASCLDKGLTIDPATVEWWLRMEDKRVVKEAFTSGPRIQLSASLQEFAAFIGAGSLIYGKGPSFDQAILRRAYAACDLPVPWVFWNERCVRTEIEMIERQGGQHVRVDNPSPHHALYDAMIEAHEIVESWKTLTPAPALSESTPTTAHHAPQHS